MVTVEVRHNSGLFNLKGAPPPKICSKPVVTDGLFTSHHKHASVSDKSTSAIAGGGSQRWCSVVIELQAHGTRNYNWRRQQRGLIWKHVIYARSKKEVTLHTGNGNWGEIFIGTQLPLLNNRMGVSVRDSRWALRAKPSCGLHAHYIVTSSSIS